jgi:hypothetical protein
MVITFTITATEMTDNIRLISWIENVTLHYKLQQGGGGGFKKRNYLMP